MSVLTKVLGDPNEREVKRHLERVAEITELEPLIEKLSPEELKAKTAEFRERLANGEQLDDVLVEAFAVVREASRRSIGLRPFDVQLVGGIVLHQGTIAEMKTGEGKTLVAVLPLYLNALEGKGAHLITVNDYLARRDAGWNAPIYHALGMSVAVIGHEMSLVYDPDYLDETHPDPRLQHLRPVTRAEAYQADITYGTNSEFGFDYLRDNMAVDLSQCVQRGLNFAIVDEVDSILIDEARTPLIISGPSTVSTHQYDKWRPLVDQLVRKQNMLCNRLASEAKELFDQGKVEDGGLAMFKVKPSPPRNKQLLRMMEDTEKRKAIDKAELSFYQDARKEELFALKEELFYTIDEKSNESDLSEQGRAFLNPDEPDSFVLPDLISEFTEIDLDPDLTPEQKEKAKVERQQHCDAQAERIHNISQLLRAYCLFEKDVAYVIEDNKVVIVDEYTGRKMPGRRWSDGLHQAVEAKEGVQIDRET